MSFDVYKSHFEAFFAAIVGKIENEMQTLQNVSVIFGLIRQICRLRSKFNHSRRAPAQRSFEIRRQKERNGLPTILLGK